MGFTYSGDPTTSELDEVRFYIGDTDPDRPMLDDAEIEFVIERWGALADTLLFAGAACAEMIAARYAREVNVSADGTSVSVGELQQKYLTLAQSLRDQAKDLLVSGPLADNILVSTTRDLTIKPLNFGVGFMDNIAAGRQEFGDWPESAGPEWPETAS